MYNTFTLIPTHTTIQPVIIQPVVVTSTYPIEQVIQPVLMVPGSPIPNRVLVCPGAPKKAKRTVHYNVRPIPFPLLT
jgi:hypothetical protein